MATWRSLGVLLVTLVAAASGRAQTCTLTETPQEQECYHYHLDMKLSGALRVHRDGQVVPIPLNAVASHDFVERVLAVDGGLPVKNARAYSTAHTTITVGSDKTEHSLRPDRQMIVAQRYKDQFFGFCPEGPLTREELDVTAHLDTLALTGLLPGKAVAVGATWKLPNAVVQAVCSFEGLISQDLTCKLEGVENGVARFSISGPAKGIDLGAIAQLTIQSTCRYDLNLQRLVGVEWKQKDEREQGPASPASTIETTTTLTRDILDGEPKALSEYALATAGVPDGKDSPPEEMLQLCYKDPKDRYHLVFGREWRLVGQTDEHLILRLMSRGEFIAQVTLTPWDKAEPGKHMSGDDLQTEMDNTPGWNADEKREDGEVPAEHKGHWIYRISALGELDGLKVMQNYFVVAGPKGDQVVLAFTMREGMAVKLGTRDLLLANGLEFAGSPKDQDKK
jgi:hypothetical protein